MSRTLSARLAAVAAALAFTAFPSTLHAQKALVYCPVGIDATGCNAIVAALVGDASRFPGGADAGYDGTQGTVDLATADLSAYAVFVVPSLADGPDVQPYSLLRNGTIAGRIQAGFMGRVAVWSGTPDVGSTNRSTKDQLIRNLAAWARPDAAGTHGPGVVALQDNSDGPATRYAWLGGISAISVLADTTFEVYSNVQVLTATGQTILTNSNGLQIGYTNMASYGLVPAAGGRSDATGGRSTRVVLVTAVGDPSDTPMATVNTDKEDYAPGDTVTVTGSGWELGETVTLKFYEDTVINLNRTISTVADGVGNILNKQFVALEQDLGVRFVLIATGQTSGRTAQATFTDNRQITAATVNGGASVVVLPSGAITAGVTVNTTTNVGGGENWFSTSWTYATTSPAANFNTPCADTPDHTTAGTFTETFSTTAPSTPGTYNAYFLAWRTANCGNNQSNLFTLPSAVIVSAATKLVFTTSPFTVVVGQCSPAITVQTQNATNAPTSPSVNTTVGLTSSSSGGAFYSDAACTAPITSVDIPTSGNNATFRYKDSNAGGPTLTASAAPLANGTQTETINKASTSTAILTDLPDPSDPGQAVTVTYAVSVTSPGAGTPTGNVTVSDGVSSCTGTAAAGSCSVGLTTSGARTLTATYAGDLNFIGSTSPGAAHQVVTATTTALARTTGASPSTYGDPLTFTATVTRTVGGTAVTAGQVTFKSGACDVGTTIGGPTALNGSGQAAFSTSSLTVPGSPYTIRACFADAGGTFAASDASLSQQVNKKGLTIAAENKARVFGAPNPTFTVIYNGFVLNETESVLGGTLNCTTPATAASTVAGSPYAINCTGQTSGNYTLNYTPGQLSITVAGTTTAANNSTGTFGDASVTLTATVTANSPSTATVNEGSVDFTVNGTTISGNVSNGSATAALDLSGVNAGTYSIAASYKPKATDPNFQASTDATPATLTVDPAPTTTTIARSAGTSPSTYGDAVTFRATVHYTTTAGTPSGTSTVTFKDGATSLGSAVALGGTCSAGTKTCTADLTIASLNVPDSPHSITAHFDGEGNFAASTSAPLSHTVEKAPLTITAEDKTRIFGAPNPTFTAIYDGFVLGETEAVLGGSLNCTVTGSAVGTYPITCTGQTAANYALTYKPGKLTITPAPTTTVADNASATYGDANVALKVKVTANAPSTASVDEGEVEFTVKQGGTTIGSPITVAVSATGTATATFPLGATVNAGSYAIQARYQPATPTANFEASSDDATLEVKPAPTTTALELKTGANPSTYGDELTFEATVTYEAPSGTPSSSSTVTFNEGTTALGAPVALGSCVTATKTCKAVFSIASLDVSGSPHSITAHYDGNGNGNFAASTSAQVHQTVNQKDLTITAQNASREYGDANPAFTVAYDGFVLGQNETALGGSLTCSTTASKPSALADGPYPITCLGQTSANYALTYKPGSLSLTKAPLTVTANSYSKFYGDGLPVFAGTVVTLKNNDPITATYKAYEAVGGLVPATATTPASPTPYPIVVTLDDPQNKLPNYTKSLVDGKLTINKATPVYASLSAPTIIFGAASTVLSGKLSYAGQGSGGVTVYPSGSVLITVNNTTAQSSISGATGDFSVAFPSGTLPASGTGHAIKYDYPSDANFTSAIDNTRLLKVLYNTAVGHQYLQPINPNLTSGNRSSFRIGSVIPAKFQIFRADGTTPVTTAIAKISVFKIDNVPETQVNEELLSIPADDGIYFRVSGGQYIYNLGTKNWTAGTFKIVATLDDLSTVEAIVDGRSK